MKVTVKKPHTHAGRDLEPGAVIDVDDSTLAWLVEQDVVDIPVTRSATQATTQAPAPAAAKE